MNILYYLYDAPNSKDDFLLIIKGKISFIKAVLKI